MGLAAVQVECVECQPRMASVQQRIIGPNNFSTSTLRSQLGVDMLLPGWRPCEAGHLGYQPVS